MIFLRGRNNFSAAQKTFNLEQILFGAAHPKLNLIQLGILEEWSVFILLKIKIGATKPISLNSTRLTESYHF